LRLEIEVETDSDSLHGNLPCQLALVDFGYRAIPRVISKAVGTVQGERDRAALAWVLESILGTGSDGPAGRAAARELVRLAVARLGPADAPGAELFLKALGG